MGLDGGVNELLSRLPAVEVLRGRCRAMAMLDAILCPEWADRYHSFDARWGDGEEMASMRNGSGDDWFVVFSGIGVYGRGFDHRVPNAPEVLDVVPEVFGSQVREPAFADHDGSPLATACFWREPGDAGWGVSTAGVGDAGLFELLVGGSPAGYRDWAAEYFGVEVSLGAVEHVYSLRPLTSGVVAELNAEVTLGELGDDIGEIDYPR